MLEFYDFVYMGIFVLVILVLKEIIEYVFITRRRNNVTQFNNKRDIIENFYQTGEACSDPDDILIDTDPHIQSTLNCDKVSFTYCNDNWPKLATILKLSLDEINKLKFLIQCISIKDDIGEKSADTRGSFYRYAFGGNQSIFLDANLYLGKKSIDGQFKCSENNIRDLFTSIVNTKEIRGWKYSDSNLLDTVNVTDLRGTDNNYEYNSVPSSGEDEYGVSIISNKLNLKSAVEVYGGLEVSGKIDSYLHDDKTILNCDPSNHSLRVWPRKKNEGRPFVVNYNNLQSYPEWTVRGSSPDTCD
jgi:hypothetical protein